MRKRRSFLLSPVYVTTAPELLDKYAIPVLLAGEDKDVRTPVTTYALTSASSEPTDVHVWLHANCFPNTFELSRDVFQQVMYAPLRPLVLIVATPCARQEDVSSKLTEVAQKWRPGVVACGDVVLTWMDAEQWGK